MPTNRVYGYSGLVAVLGLLALLVGLIVLVALPDIRTTAWIVLALGIALLITAFILDFRQVGRALVGRRGRFSTGTTVMVSIFIGITIIVNAISIGNHHRFDLTGVAQFTLTTQTKDVLRQLKTPVQALLFFTPNDPYGISNYATSLLTEYQNQTDLLTLKTIDPDEHPDQARQYGITQYQTVVFESQKRRRLVTPLDIAERAEHAFTSGILEVTGTVQKKVYFLTGHGEGNVNSQATGGYSRALLSLFDNLYQVGILDLTATPRIPEDGTALIIAAPQTSLGSNERAIIERYLRSGGWAMILINPDSPPDIRQLISAWGVDIEDGTVIDPASYVTPSIESPSVPRTRNFFGLPEIYFPGATAIIPQQTEEKTLAVSPLAWTSKDSWLERNFTAGQEPVFDEGTDRKGSLALGVIISAATVGETPDEELLDNAQIARLIIIGDSDFATNQHFYNGNNGDFFIGLVNFLTEGKELVAIERKILPFRRLLIGPDAERFINYSSVALLPVLVIVIGGIIWWRRR